MVVMYFGDVSVLFTYCVANTYNMNHPPLTYVMSYSSILFRTVQEEDETDTPEQCGKRIQRLVLCSAVTLVVE